MSQQPPDRIDMAPIAHAYSPFQERFGIPRQAGLTPAVTGRIVPLPPWNEPDAWTGIESFSHLWLIWHVHGRPHKPVKSVRPPRLGGNVRVGVFASRSPVRPNPIGLSLVRLVAVHHQNGRIELEVSGLDLLDGTPILDIKPHVAYADCPSDSHSGFARTAPTPLPVDFSGLSAADRDRLDDHQREVIAQTLALDPRPAFHVDPGRVYGCRLFDFDVQFRIVNGTVQVLGLERPV